MKKLGITCLVFFGIYLCAFFMTGSVNPLDLAKALSVRAMGIKPNIPYFHSTQVRVGQIFYDFHNYPFLPPLKNIEQAENAPFRVIDPYSTRVIIATVGDNYQYKEKRFYSRKPQYILLNQAQLDSIKDIENGIYFFDLDVQERLISLPSAEAALALPNYIKVIKEMGKITSIEKKPLTEATKAEYYYWPYSGEIKYIMSTRYALDRQTILSYSQIEFDEKGEMTKSIDKDGNNRIIGIEVFYPRGEQYYSETSIFNSDGVKTNLFFYSLKGKHENRHLDEKGNVVKITHENIRSRKQEVPEESEEYKKLVIDSSKEHKRVDSMEPHE